MTGLVAHSSYSLLRYDTTDAPTHGFSCGKADACVNFTASEASQLVVDPRGFKSDTAVHWRVLVVA